MIARLVSLCLAHRGLVVVILIGLAGQGLYSWSQLSVEAYPDIADTTAQVITQHPGHAAEEVEELITVPLERALNGIPGLHVMRSRSTFGLSLITLVFRDGVEDYWARQRIRERISGVPLPSGVEPDLDPLASPVGEIYRYTLESETRHQRELRDLQDWVVIPALRQAFGVADVSTFGGEVREYQLLLVPDRLVAYGLTLHQVLEAIRNNNANAGGSVLTRGDQAFVVRGIGKLRSLEDIGNIVVTQKAGTPVLLAQLGQLTLGAPQRRGILGKDRNPDAVSGIVLLLRGQNPSEVLAGIHRKVDALNHGGLPKDVRVVPYMDRTELVQTTIRTVGRTLLEGMGLVVVVLLLFLGSLRGALVVAVTIPLALLLAFIAMYHAGVPANLLSLGAIDFGIIVDGGIVMLESVLRRREQDPSRVLDEADVRGAAQQVARPMFFAMAIIVTAYLPLFAFQRVEKKLFTPLAFTIGFALLAATLIALCLTPGLAFLSYRRPRRVFHNRTFSRFSAAYERVLRWTLRRPLKALAPGVVAILLGVGITVGIGKSFLPELDEGSLWLQVTLPPGISIQHAAQLSDQLREALREFPEVSGVVTQTGRVEDGMDPWTPSHVEVPVMLHPPAEWPDGVTKHELIERMRQRLARIPGLQVGFSQPIIDMVNDKIAGAHSELVLKIFGADFAELRRVAGGVAQILSATRGAADVAVDQEPPLPQLRIEIDRAACARLGINVADIGELISVAVGGQPVDQLALGERRYAITVRYPEVARGSLEAIGNLLIAASARTRVPLSQVARLSLQSGESTITREDARRHLTVKLNLRGRALSSFLAEAQARVAGLRYDRSRVQVTWGGQFENQQRAQGRLALMVPVALGIIFVLLVGAFHHMRYAAVVMACVPLALLGGILALLLRGMTLNVSSAVGFIALFGVAVQNGVLLISNVQRLRGEGRPLEEAVLGGTVERLRPVLMTALVAMLGLLPAALASGIGSDVQRPLATVIVGGLCSSTLLTLLVLPALYLVVERRAGRRAQEVA